MPTAHFTVHTTLPPGDVLEFFTDFGPDRAEPVAEHRRGPLRGPRPGSGLGRGHRRQRDGLGA